MSVHGIIYKAIKEIESEFDGVIAYAYQDSNEPQTNAWWQVCVSDYDIYCSQRFKDLCSRYHQRIRLKGSKVVFAYCSPIEKRLEELALDDNLIMNV